MYTSVAEEAICLVGQTNILSLPWDDAIKYVICVALYKFICYNSEIYVNRPSPKMFEITEW